MHGSGVGWGADPATQAPHLHARPCDDVLRALVVVPRRAVDNMAKLRVVVWAVVVTVLLWGWVTVLLNGHAEVSRRCNDLVR